MASRIRPSWREPPLPLCSMARSVGTARSAADTGEEEQPMSRTPPRLLVLGGTRFVGRAVVEQALCRGWKVTTLNRGTAPPAAGATAVRGDRTRPDGLSSLSGGRWDVLVDTWSWASDAVGRAAVELVDRVGHCAYISTRSVYSTPTDAGADETAPLVAPAHGPDAGYAERKLASEQAVTDVFGDRALRARAGLILGPREDVGRLPWWLDRIARGGRVLAPGPPDLDLQFIDVRDLAAWTLDAAQKGLAGPYNVVAPAGHTTTAELLHACIDATGADAELVWVDPAVLEEAGVQPWTQLPIWIPPGPLHDTMHRADVTAATTAGLRCRPAAETVADTWRWMRSIASLPVRADRPPVGLDAAVERRLLQTLAGP